MSDVGLVLAGLRRSWWAALSIAGLLGAGGYLSLTAPLGQDYPGPPCDTCDFAGPPIDSLSHGDVGHFFSLQPVMGSVSLILRAPFALLARELGRSEQYAYQLGALACLAFAAVVFAAVVARQMDRRGQSKAAQVVILGLFIAGPLTVQALRWGHPEELLAAALCIGGVVAAARRQPALAGALLGLALATKLWAWLAFLPALIVVARGERIRFTAWFAGAAALFIVPMLAGDPHRFLDQIHHYSVPGNGLTPSNIWWVYGHEAGLDVSQGIRGNPTYALPALLGKASHLLVLAASVGLTAVYWFKRRERDPLDILLLVALIFLLRCMLDPLTYSYHHIPFFVALLSYEGLRRRGMPWVSMFVATLVYVMTKKIAPMDDPTLLNRVYLAWAVPVATYLSFAIALPDGIRWERRLLGDRREPARAAA